MALNDPSLVEDIIAVLRAQLGTGAGEQALTASAREWLEAGFDDPEEIEDWLRARCSKPEGARKLEDAGITPQQAAIETRAGGGDYKDTIGHKVIQGDLSLDEARRIITTEFWNS